MVINRAGRGLGPDISGPDADEPAATVVSSGRGSAIAQALWLKCWLAAYADAGRISVAGADLVRRRYGAGPIPLTVLHSPTNLQTPRHAAAFAAPALPAAMTDALKRNRAAGIMLDYLPEADLAALRTTLAQAGAAHLAMPQAAIPITDCEAAFEHFISRRSKRERQRARRLLKLADQPNGPLVFSVVTGGSQVGTCLEQCFALEQASWKGREGTAILDSPADARFYRHLARDLAEAGLMRLALLHDCAGQLVAFELCMIWADRLIALKTSCSEVHLDLSPGHVLALLHIRHSCADPAIRLYDVTGNGLNPAAHLLRYADDQELLWRVAVFAPGWRGLMLRVIWQTRLRLRRVKRFLAGLRR